MGLLGWIVDREPDEGCGGGLVATCLVLNCEVGLGSLEEDGTVRVAVDEGRVGGDFLICVVVLSYAAVLGPL